MGQFWLTFIERWLLYRGRLQCFSANWGWGGWLLSAEYLNSSPVTPSTPEVRWLCNLLSAVRISSSDIGWCNGLGMHSGTPWVSTGANSPLNHWDTSICTSLVWPFSTYTYTSSHSQPHQVCWPPVQQFAASDSTADSAHSSTTNVLPSIKGWEGANHCHQQDQGSAMPQSGWGGCPAAWEPPHQSAESNGLG